MARSNPLEPPKAIIIRAQNALKEGYSSEQQNKKRIVTSIVFICDPSCSICFGLMMWRLMPHITSSQ
jgi:hypothetical protein